MQYGKSYWMMIFWKPTRMVLYFDVTMACIAEYFLNLHIFSRLSWEVFHCHFMWATLLILPHRVLLATIWDKGLCPCPLCLIPKSDFARLGLVSNMSTRLTKIHEYFCDQIRAACDAIYKLGSPIKGTMPEHYLKEFSLVPTIVSDLLHLWWLQELKCCWRTHLPTSLVHSDAICSEYWLSTSCTTLNLGYSSPSWHIYCSCCMLSTKMPLSFSIPGMS